MGSFSTGIGLISGFDSATIIEQMLLGESRTLSVAVRDRDAAVAPVLHARTQRASARTSVCSVAAFVECDVRGMQIASSRDDVLTATVAGGTPAGDWSFIVESLAARHQVLAGGSSSRDAALGLESFSIEFGGTLNPTTRLDELNGGVGIDRGRMELVLGTGDDASTHVVDCSSIADIQDVIAAIESVDARLQVSIDDTSLRIEALDGSSISFSSLDGATTAEDLGLVGDGSGCSKATRWSGSTAARCFAGSTTETAC